MGFRSSGANCVAACGPAFSSFLVKIQAPTGAIDVCGDRERGAAKRARCSAVASGRVRAAVVPHCKLPCIPRSPRSEHGLARGARLCPQCSSGGGGGAPLGAAGGWPARHLKVHGRDRLCGARRGAPVYITFGYVNRAAARDGPPRESTENRRPNSIARPQGQGTIRPPYRPASGAQCVTWEGRGGARGTPLCMLAACPPPTLLAHPAAGAVGRSRPRLASPRPPCAARRRRARPHVQARLGHPRAGGGRRASPPHSTSPPSSARRRHARPDERQAPPWPGARQQTPRARGQPARRSTRRRWTAAQRQRARGA